MEMRHFFLLILFSSLICTSFSERCNPNDKKALFQIKASLITLYNLVSWIPNTDCCDWNNVECDETTNRINSLTILTGVVSGQIPSSVGDLPFLETLIFHKLSNLTGQIPSTISKLKHLKEVKLSNNNLSGPVPEFFSQLKSLTFLDLSFNQLTGSIPTSLSSLSNLRTLRLDRNKLTGSIPGSFGKFYGENRPYVYLSHNQLSGTIPRSLGDANFGLIDLSRNKLGGDASMLFGYNKSTQILDISRNSFEFDLTKVKIPKDLNIFDISHNKIYGSIPPEITLIFMSYLNVTYNRLCGQIPAPMRVHNFDYDTYFHNRCLCGAPSPVVCK